MSITVNKLDPDRIKRFEPQPDTIELKKVPQFIPSNHNDVNPNAANRVRDILRETRRHRPQVPIIRRHPKDWEGKPLPAPRSRVAKNWTCETSVINTEISGVKVSLYVFYYGLAEPRVVVEVAKGPEYMKGWCSHAHGVDNRDQLPAAIEKCKNKLQEEVIKPGEEQKRVNQKCKNESTKPEKKAPEEKSNLLNPKAELKKLFEEMKDFDPVYKAFVEGWKKRKNPNHVPDPKLFQDPRIQKLAEQLKNLELIFESLQYIDQFDPAATAEYLAECLREQLADFEVKKQNEPTPWYEKAIGMLKEKLQKIEDFQKKVQATIKKPLKPLLKKMDAIDKVVKGPARVTIKDARKDLKYFGEKGKYEAREGMQEIDRSYKLSKTAEKIEQTVKNQKGNKVRLKIDGETKTVSKQAASKIADNLRSKAHKARFDGAIQTAKGVAKTSAANVGRAALKNAKEQVNGFGDAAGGSFGGALASAITDKELREHPKELVKTVAKETTKSIVKESAKSLGHAAGKAAVEQASTVIADIIPSVSVLTFLWNVGENAVESKTPEGFAFKTGLMTANTGISLGCAFVGQTLIPIPVVGAAVGSFAGGLLNQGVNWVVTEVAKELDVLPNELCKT